MSPIDRLAVFVMVVCCFVDWACGMVYFHDHDWIWSIVSATVLFGSMLLVELFVRHARLKGIRRRSAAMMQTIAASLEMPTVSKRSKTAMYGIVYNGKR